MITDEQLQRVAVTLNNLPPICRRVFILVRHEGLNYKQVAEELHIHECTVRLYVQRIIHDCQTAISNNE